MSNRLTRLLLALFIKLIAFSVNAAELNSIDVAETDGNYSIKIVATLDADWRTIKNIIVDYENLPTINPYLLESKIIDDDAKDKVTVSMLTKACVLIICYRIRHVQTFSEMTDSIIEAVVIPEQSDLLSGWTRWEIQADNSEGQEKTNIVMQAEIAPDFFIFPIIGPYQMKKMVVRITSETIHNLEKKAALLDR